jgi:SHS2 domain-containing protein
LTSKPAAASHFPLDHTADLGVEIDAPSREALFAEAAIGLADTLTDTGAVAPSIERRLELEAQDDELLLVDFLSEVLFLFETEGFLVAAAAVELEGGGASPSSVRLRATLRGAEYDEIEHPLRSLVKAITYHGLRIWRDGERFRARVLFDL